MAHNRTDTGEAWKGMLAGVAGGLVASWTMELFQAVWSNLSEISTPSADKKSGGSDDEDSTMKGAEKIAETLFHTRLTKEERKKAGPMLHYALGASAAGVYGTLAEFRPELTSGGGLPFGTFFWLAMDEGSVPLLGLSKPPNQYPLSTHVYALASHLVFGVTTELVRRIVRDVL
jgi:putative membrane protein